MQNKIDMSKVAPYADRDTIRERLMVHPMAESFKDAPDEDQNKYLDQIMNHQFVQAATRIATFVSNELRINIMKIPIKVRLRYTACRIPMISLTPFRACNLQEYIK